MEKLEYKATDWGLELYTTIEKTNLKVQIGAAVYPKGEKPDPEEYLTRLGHTNFKKFV